MTGCGIICEYNPFHSGHKYHIEKARELTGADIVVAVMSGNYVQRGDIAIFDKQLRSKAAIQNGIDLVIELPTVMSLCSAERFASCGIEILNSLKLVDYICFGAECDNLSLLENIAQTLSYEPEIFKETLTKDLKSGLSYAKARENALFNIIPQAKDIINSPNNILAIEYLKALINTNSPIKPILVKRTENNYNSTALNGQFISATAVRNLINSKENLESFVPDNTLSIYENAKIHNIKNMEKAIIANICKMSAEEISMLPDVSEGLENKIKKEALSSSDFSELCDNIKSKRYAHSRIRRILLYSYLGIKKDDLVSPSYIKILDFNEKGRTFLNKIKQETSLPLVKNFNQIKAMNNPVAETIWKNELTFDRIYDLF